MRYFLVQRQSRFGRRQKLNVEEVVAVALTDTRGFCRSAVWGYQQRTARTQKQPWYRHRKNRRNRQLRQHRWSDGIDRRMRFGHYGEQYHGPSFRRDREKDLAAIASRAFQALVLVLSHGVVLVVSLRRDIRARTAGHVGAPSDSRQPLRQSVDKLNASQDICLAGTRNFTPSIDTRVQDSSPSEAYRTKGMSSAHAQGVAVVRRVAPGQARPSPQAPRIRRSSP